jgi:hypothetical protein
MKISQRGPRITHILQEIELKRTKYGGRDGLTY